MSETTDHQIVRTLSHVENREDAQQLWNVVSLDALRGPVAVEPLQTSVAEADDHTDECIA